MSSLKRITRSQRKNLDIRELQVRLNRLSLTESGTSRKTTGKVGQNSGIFAARISVIQESENQTPSEQNAIVSMNTDGTNDKKVTDEQTVSENSQTGPNPFNN